MRLLRSVFIMPWYNPTIPPVSQGPLVRPGPLPVGIAHATPSAECSLSQNCLLLSTLQALSYFCYFAVSTADSTAVMPHPWAIGVYVSRYDSVTCAIEGPINPGC